MHNLDLTCLTYSSTLKSGKEDKKRYKKAIKVCHKLLFCVIFTVCKILFETMSLRKKLKLDTTEDVATNQHDHAAESPYFKPLPDYLVYPTPNSNYISDNLLKIELNLVSKLKCLSFKSPVDCVYNPLEYAYVTHSVFVKKYCCNPKKILFLGLNPGPWGMAQTGVPFGEVNITRDWLKIDGPVEKPANEISIRPVTGFQCHRSEISGKKFWSLFQKLCGTPENFFKYSYMHNYCPLLLMKNTGSNVTPADLKNSESAHLLNLCDESLSEIIKLLQIEIIVGIGRFAQKRAEETIKSFKLNNVRVVFLVHPSPRIPRNEDWHDKATKTLTEVGLIGHFTK